MSNQNIIAISGKSATGKTVSLRNLNDPKGVMYLNCESNKALPFKSGFDEYTVTDPMQVHEAFPHGETQPHIHTIVVDSLDFLMDQYESQYVLTSANTMKAWGDYAQFFKKMMQKYVAESTKNCIFLAHTTDVMNESEMVMDTVIKIKGSVMNNGVESYFSNVISTKKMPIRKIEKYQSDLLNITEEEELLGFKYLFQVKLTKETVNERIRGPLGMWETSETYIDNDLQLVIDRLHQYYS